MGDVALNEFFEDGTIDIGQSMKKSSQEIYACLLEMDAYELDLGNRPIIEEQIFLRTFDQVSYFKLEELIDSFSQYSPNGLMDGKICPPVG